MTLLEMTQNILASMDSDEVNAIADTAESLQVAGFIRDSYNYLMTSIDLPEHYTFFELTASANTSRPNLMFLPDNCDELLWLKYDVTEPDEVGTRMEFVEYLEPYDFFERAALRLGSDPDTGVSILQQNGEFFPNYYWKERNPTQFTNFNDRTLIFDAVNLDEDSVLQKSKSMAFGKLNYEFTMTNNFVPNLSNKHFSLLYNEAKAQAFIELKQQPNPVAERRARKGWIRTQYKKDSVQDPYENYRNLMNFGRRR